MKRPSATYRLQFRNGMTFDRASALVPYLARLGVSHLYASPLFKAVSDSSHGYDVVDVTQIEPALGGADGLRRFAGALQEHGLGLILDFVPNHMAASPQNPWWYDVLEWGASSRYAHHFDIDWSAPKLLAPVLAAGYGEMLQSGEFGLAFDQKSGEISFTYGALALPLTPPSYGQILARIDKEGFAELTRKFAVTTPEETPHLKAELSQAACQRDVVRAVEQTLADIAGDHEKLHRLHEAQIWRLANWRAAREALTYRRFFEIPDYVGLKVESRRVFDDVHARLLGLVANGSIAGIRLDHVDGLADPRIYLERLQSALGDEQQFYLVVEKILEAGEELRRDWPVAGTTGYELITSLSGLLVSQDSEPEMTRCYEAFVGREVSYSELVADTKRDILARNLFGELNALESIARRLAERHIATRDLGPDTLRRAIIEVMTALPVYRTYVGVGGQSPQDRALIAGAVDRARETREVEDETTIELVRQMLELDFSEPEDQALALEFTLRFQQTSGPVMAKAVEDTAFFRYNRLIALNEVGGSPDHFGVDLEEFHRKMSDRAVQQPGGLSATATHDTKLGEDARARLYVLSEDPQTWADAVDRWCERNAAFSGDVGGTRVPEPEIEWRFYQALAAIWPPDGESDGDCAKKISARMSQHMLKAVREAKVHTRWTAPNEKYEHAIESFVRGALDPARAAAFHQDFATSCRPIMLAGAVNSCTQILVKIAAPGVPDIYQGAELWDLSLVDPDNRRPVDFEERSRFLDELDGLAPDEMLTGWRSGHLKMHLLRAGLRLRAEMATLFEEGDYSPLTASGKLAGHVVSFTRSHESSTVAVVAPRLVLKLLQGCTTPMVPAARWGSTVASLPRELSGRDWRNVLTGETIRAADRLPLSVVLQAFPVALLASQSQ